MKAEVLVSILYLCLCLFLVIVLKCLLQPGWFKIVMWYLLQRERIENDMAIKRRREELIEEAKQKGMIP